MKTMLAAAFVLCSAASASALEFQTPVTQHLYTCDRAGLSRVAATPDPAPCCEGQLKCAQYLSTTGVLVPRRHRRT